MPLRPQVKVNRNDERGFTSHGQGSDRLTDDRVGDDNDTLSTVASALPREPLHPVSIIQTAVCEVFARCANAHTDNL